MTKLKGNGERSGRSWQNGVLSWIGCWILAMGLAGSGNAQGQTPPLPPPRPDRFAPPESANNKPASEEAAGQKGSNGEGAAFACTERLTKLGLRFEMRPSMQEKSCNIGNPVSIWALPNGIEVTPASLMECSFAEGLARWVNDVVTPRASEHFQSVPTKLMIGASYECRDQRSGEKPSEHAFGDGVDVTGFEFDKHPLLQIRFHAEGSPEAAFQSAIQKGACTIFSTVLGPGADDDHGNHFHLDMRVRKGNYRICQ